MPLPFIGQAKSVGLPQQNPDQWAAMKGQGPRGELASQLAQRMGRKMGQNPMEPGGWFGGAGRKAQRMGMGAPPAAPQAASELPSASPFMQNPSVGQNLQAQQAQNLQAQQVQQNQAAQQQQQQQGFLAQLLGGGGSQNVAQFSQAPAVQPQQDWLQMLLSQSPSSSPLRSPFPPPVAPSFRSE